MRTRLLLPALLAAFALLAPASPAAAAAVPGVQAHLLWGSVDSAELGRQMDQARSSGARLLRVDVGWASLEGDGKGRWSSHHLGRLDNLVTQAERRNLQLLLTFWETPCWASSAPASEKLGCTGRWWDRGVQRYPPTDVRDYADALAFVAARYGNRVAGWEVWNEPNASNFFRADDPVGQYVALLRAAYPAAKAAAPAVPVIGGSLMYSDEAWTRAAYAAGVKGAFDAWSVHPYSEDRSPLADRPLRYRRLSFADGVPAVRQAMLDHGDDKPVWLTEFGWHTSTTRGAEAWRNGVDLGTQATYTAEALAKVAEWSWVGAIVAFNLRDTSTDPASREGNFGLFRHDGTPKPVVAAFRAGADALAAGAPASAASSWWGQGSATPARRTAARAAAAGHTMRSVQVKVRRCSTRRPTAGSRGRTTTARRTARSRARTTTSRRCGRVVGRAARR